MYDPWQNVCGFVELRTNQNSTSVKVRHNVPVAQLVSVTYDGQTCTFNLDGKNRVFQIDNEIDLDNEITACLMQRNADAIIVAASGIINPQERVTPAITLPVQTEKEIPSAVIGAAEVVKAGSLGEILVETAQNPISRETATPDKYQTDAAREIDELLRKVCTIDTQGRGICETCPYRDHFFGESII